MIHVQGKICNIFDLSMIGGSYEIVTRRTRNVNESKVSKALAFSYFVSLYVNARDSFSISQRRLERLPTEASVDHAIACWEWQESSRQVRVIPLNYFRSLTYHVKYLSSPLTTISCNLYLAGIAKLSGDLKLTLSGSDL